jgi:hypothetical protein
MACLKRNTSASSVEIRFGRILGTVPTKALSEIVPKKFFTPLWDRDNIVEGRALSIWVMPEYRIYTLIGGRQIQSPPEIVDCKDDREAIEEAKQLLDGAPIEIWQSARRVIRLEPGAT